MVDSTAEHRKTVWIQCKRSTTPYTADIRQNQKHDAQQAMERIRHATTTLCARRRDVPAATTSPVTH